MNSYTIDANRLYFRQGTLPACWMVIFGQLEIQVTVTGSHRYPYMVEMSESDFMQAIELAKEL